MQLIAKIISFLILALVSSVASAETKLFSCKPPFSMFDSTFQQGSEVYVDIYVNAKNQSKIVYATSVGPAETLYDYSASSHFHIDLKQSTSVSEWNNETYLSAVYMGSQWGAVLKFQNAMVKGSFTFVAGQEQDLFCQEAEYFKGL